MLSSYDFVAKEQIFARIYSSFRYMFINRLKEQALFSKKIYLFNFRFIHSTSIQQAGFDKTIAIIFPSSD